MLIKYMLIKINKFKFALNKTLILFICCVFVCKSVILRWCVHPTTLKHTYLHTQFQFVIAIHIAKC
jgi:hypothetical protein